MPGQLQLPPSARLPLVLSALFLASQASAQGPLPLPSVQGINEGAQVVVLTRVPAPWYAPRALIVSKFRDSIPEYEAIPGLQYKYYTLTDDKRFGGLYLWKTRVQAQAWFNDAWFARVRKERGADGDAIYFDAPVVLDNGKPGEPPPGADGNAVAAIVTIALPPGANREAVVAEFNKALPFYAGVPGLARKYFILTTDGKFGGIYLWRSREAANAFYNSAWQERVKTTYGTTASISWLEAPVILPSKLKTP